MEQGELSLLDPVEKYLPRISKIQVLESISTGEKPPPVFRAAKSKPTILNLITHSAGFSRDFLHTSTLAWRVLTGRRPPKYHNIGIWDDFEIPFLADPGAEYIYGINAD